MTNPVTQLRLKLATAALALVPVLATSLAAQAAITADDLQGLDEQSARELFAVPEDGDLTKFVLEPREIPDPENVSGDDISLTICKETVASCSPQTEDAVNFKLQEIFQADRQGDTGASDTYDYVFVPADDAGEPISGTDLKFIYKRNPNGAASWGLVLSPDGRIDGASVEDASFAGLEGFDDTSLFEEVFNEGLDIAGVETDSEVIDATEEDGGADDPIAMALGWLAEMIAGLNGAIMQALLDVVDINDLAGINGLENAWLTVRDLVNIVFILVLATIALFTILRIEAQSYSARKLLPLLIFAIISVNFSILLAEIMVNSATILSRPFVEGANALINEGGAMGEALTDVEGLGIGDAIVFLLSAVVMLIALIILLFFFVIRILVIWILVMLSPAVFLFFVLPLTRKIATDLISSWVKWVYMAPVAFIIMFLGAQVLAGELPNNSPDGDGAQALLRALFYGGVLVAAVMIPLTLGGRIMGMVQQQGMGGLGAGGKGALAGASVLPLGRGRTVGQAARTAKAFAKGRKDSMQGDAAYDAADLRLRMAGAGGPQGITGLSEGQQIALQEQMVGQREKEMASNNVPTNRRIAHAWQFGMERDGGGNTYALTHGGGRLDGIAMRTDEQRLSQDRFAAAAAYKQLAQNDISEPYQVMTPGINGRTMAWTGEQQRHTGNPIIQSYGRNGVFERESMIQRSINMPAETLKGLDTDVVRQALNRDLETGQQLNYSPEDQGRAVDILRHLDAIRLGDASDASARNKFNKQINQRYMDEIAREGLLSQGLTGQEHAEQERKEAIIRRKYRDGQNAFPP